MASLSFVTPEEHSALQQEVAQLRTLVSAFVESLDDEVDTATALKLTGIKSRTTLIEERDRPGTLLRYSKHGRSACYSRKSCIDFKLARRLPAAAPMPTLRISA